MEAKQSVSLSDLAKQGRELLTINRNCVDTHKSFNTWVENVASWLEAKAPDTKLVVEWSTLPASNLVMGGYYYHSQETFEKFHKTVQERLKWLSTVPALLSSPARPSYLSNSNIDTSSSPHVSTRKVFLVHGHDNEARETVARFVEKLGLYYPT